MATVGEERSNGKLSESQSLLLKAAIDGDSDAVDCIVAIPFDAWLQENEGVARRIIDLSNAGICPEISFVTQADDKTSDRAYELALIREGTCNPKGHAQEIRKAYQVRKIVALGNALSSGDITPADYFNRVNELAGDEPQRHKAVNIADWKSEAPQPQYVFENMMRRGDLVLVTAPGSTGKSWLTLQWNVSLALGIPVLPSFVPTAPMRVLMLASEDIGEELHRRFRRIAAYFELGTNDIDRLAENLRIYAGRAIPLTGDGNELAWFRREIKRFQPDVITIDPVCHFHQNDENDNTQMAAFANTVIDAARISGATVVMAHHVGKARENESSSAAGRGATALRDAARFVLSLTQPTADEVSRYGIVELGRFVKCEVVKANYVERPPAPILFQRVSGACGGVLVEFDAKAAEQQIKAATVDRVARALAVELGINPKNLSRREIISQPTGKWLRDLVKDTCPGATRKTFEAAFNTAERQGLIEVEIIETDGARRLIPRQRATTRTDDLRDE